MAGYVKYAELLAFLAACYAWPVLKNKPGLRFLPYLLGFICSYEWLAFVFKCLGYTRNAGLYNICNPLVYATYAIILRANLSKATPRSVLKFGSIAFVLIGAASALSFKLGTAFNVYMYSAGALLICFGAVLNIAALLKAPDDDDIFAKPAFYLWGVILLYYLVTLPYFNMNNWRVFSDKKSAVRQILLNSMTMFNFLLYGTYTVVFLWMKRKDTSS